MRKRCTNYEVEKSFSEFYEDSTHKDSLKSCCKSCDDKKIKYYNDHRDACNETRRIRDRDMLLI